jgi:predicted cupin superfamily sugar epimerase
LAPHPEGGFFRETYRAEVVVETPRGRRAACTTILFLVTSQAVSRLHRLSSDEIWVFQGGLSLELVTLAPGGEATRTLLGDPAGPEAREPGSAAPAPAPEPQALAPAGHWQGARLAGGVQLPAERAWCLVSCVVTPGFDYADFEMGEREALLAAYPQHGEIIRALT